MNHDRTEAGPAVACIVPFRVPIQEKAQVLCVLRLFYGFHPDTRDWATTRECSSILAVMAKAVSRLRRAACPVIFGARRVSTHSRNESHCNAKGSAFVIGNCSNEICRSAPTLQITASCRP